MTRPGRPTWRRLATHHVADDAGHITLLSIAYAAVALALVLTVVTATDVHLERKRLLVLADGAALAAAAALDQEEYYARQLAGVGDGGSVILSYASVRDAVDDHLAQAPATGRLTDVRLTTATSPDGRTADVTLTARTRPLLLTAVTAGWSDGIALQVTTSSRAW